MALKDQRHWMGQRFLIFAMSLNIRQQLRGFWSVTIADFFHFFVKFTKTNIECFFRHFLGDHWDHFFLGNICGYRFKFVQNVELYDRQYLTKERVQQSLVLTCLLDLLSSFGNWLLGILDRVIKVVKKVAIILLQNSLLDQGRALLLLGRCRKNRGISVSEPVNEVVGAFLAVFGEWQKQLGWLWYGGLGHLSLQSRGRYVRLLWARLERVFDTGS